MQNTGIKIENSPRSRYQTNLDYISSITIDENLMDASGLIEFEKLQVVNVNNGERLETLCN